MYILHNKIMTPSIGNSMQAVQLVKVCAFFKDSQPLTPISTRLRTRSGLSQYPRLVRMIFSSEYMRQDTAIQSTLPLCIRDFLTADSYQVWQGVYKSPTPLVPSHEPVGEIVSLGAEAQKIGTWAIGQRVGVLLFRHACGTCINCRTTGDVRFCKVRNMAGLANDGGMAEYIIGDANNCVLLPDAISYEQAAPLMCAGVCSSYIG